jgi:hypothetical protein
MTKEEVEAFVKDVGKWHPMLAGGNDNEKQAAQHLAAAVAKLAPQQKSPETGTFDSDSVVHVETPKDITRMGNFQSERRPWPGSR